MDWQNTLEIPLEPRTSESVQNLIKALLSKADHRLRTPTWEVDLSVQQGYPVTVFRNYALDESSRATKGGGDFEKGFPR
jgi:hypothetical protein